MAQLNKEPIRVGDVVFIDPPYPGFSYLGPFRVRRIVGYNAVEVHNMKTGRILKTFLPTAFLRKENFLGAVFNA